MTMQQRKFILHWVSKTVLKSAVGEEKATFREIEKSTLKLEELKSHRLFNQTDRKSTRLNSSH